MPNSSIFALIQDQLVEMRESAYDSERVLQDYLETHSTLLPGEQIDPSAPRRWLHVRREFSVPDMLDGAERWSLDHLFLDQDAVPTLVEVKRSSDTRIRREVIGQMLDYAANGTTYWTVGRIRDAFTTTCARKGLSEQDVLNDFLGPVSDGEDAADRFERFWALAEENLRRGKIRLLFVADVIPPELMRVIEFLNKQMTLTEVLGIEVRQFVGGQVKSFVPRVFGQSFEAQDVKVRPSTKSSSAQDIVPTLIRASAIPEGATISFAPIMYRDVIEPWCAQHADHVHAKWNADPNRTLFWPVDGQYYSCTGLAKKLYRLAGKDLEVLRGPQCWEYQGKNLVELASSLNGSA